MKINELHIREIRGIRDLTLCLGGKNAVVVGPNGSGKSAVVDALDFLLTGEISRLTGKGTKALTLQKHGKHVKSTLDKSFVSALVEIPGHSKPIKITRTLKAPGILDYPEVAEAAIQHILSVASKGQHALSRRQILRFITSESSDRAKGVQDLLELQRVEEFRLLIGGLARQSSSALKAAHNNLENETAPLQQLLNLPTFSEEQVLDATNTLRATLNGSPLDELNAKRLRDEVMAPQLAEKITQLNPAQVQRQKDAFLSQRPKDLSETIPQYSTLVLDVSILKEDREALAELRRLQLFRLGIDLLEEDGHCPLCGYAWPQGELEKHIREHLEKAEAIKKRKAMIENLAHSLQSTLRERKVSLKFFADTASQTGATALGQSFEEREKEISKLIELLESPLRLDAPALPSSKSLTDIFCSDDVTLQLEELSKKANKAAPKPSPQQDAWDILGKVEVRLLTYEKQRRECRSSFQLDAFCKQLPDLFEASRNGVLTELYKQVEDRFSELYQAIHQEDESSFSSTLQPDGAGLRFEVDFYGEGMFPPHALHSEGHQDSMGLCLYLALAERLTRGTLNVTILDDVVMSVDADHRRHICQMLRDHFSDRQFIITTHERMWSHQLLRTGVVERGNVTAFSGWTVEDGPRSFYEDDLWDRIEEALDRGDVPEAAARLRRNAESFFEEVCDRLRAPVPYRGDGRYTLGDFAPPALGALGKALKEAKKAANSFNQTDLLKSIVSEEERIREVNLRTKVDIWDVNMGVHFSRWSSLAKPEFVVVRDAWRDSMTLFLCKECTSMLWLERDGGGHKSTLRCPCNRTSYNLHQRPSSLS